MKRTALRRRHRPTATPEVKSRRRNFRDAVLRRDGRCLLCPPGVVSVRLQAAHVIKRQVLERHGLDPWDPRIGMCLCEHHHQRHDHHVQRVPARLFPADAALYADEHDVVFLLWRELHPLPLPRDVPFLKRPIASSSP